MRPLRTGSQFWLPPSRPALARVALRAAVGFEVDSFDPAQEVAVFAAQDSAAGPSAGRSPPEFRLCFAIAQHLGCREALRSPPRPQSAALSSRILSAARSFLDRIAGLV